MSSKANQSLQNCSVGSKKLKTETYDFSIDVRNSAAVSHWILPFIKVKKSYGFGSRGYGGLLEKEFFLPDESFHVYDNIATLLNEIGVESNTLAVKAYLPFHSENKENITKKIANLSNSLLFFPESGGEIKMFDNDFWITLCREILEKNDYHLLLCGEKTFTKNLFEALQKALPNFQNRIAFTGQLSLAEVAVLPQIAPAAITLDSFPAHLCSIFCKTLVLSKNAAGYQFFPLNNSPTLILHNHLPSSSINLNRANFESHYVADLDNIFTIKPELNTLMDFIK